MIKRDPSFWKAALTGYRMRKEEVERAIADIGRRLGVPSAPPRSEPAGPSPKRKMSAAARKRIAAAQKKRWTEYRKNRQ